jgi:glyoxylase-like metal-dependent hydrolase (beta-lactamase superfamily II)
MSSLNLDPLPAFTDNYIWVLHDGHGRPLVVDPGDAAPRRTDRWTVMVLTLGSRF